MEAFADFDAARAERQRVAPTFTLGGETFRCFAAPAAGPSLDLVGIAGAPAYRAWVRSCLRDDDAVTSGSGDEVEKSSLERFDLLLYRRGDDAIEIDDLIALGDWLSGVYAGRPTERSSDSSDGPPPAGPSSRRVSLTPGETRSR